MPHEEETKVSNTFELVRRGSDEPLALACAKCGSVWGLAHREAAERCCNPHCMACGVSTPRGWSLCTNCRARLDVKRDEESYAAATKVSLADYLAELGPDAMVCTERLGGEGTYRVATDARDSGIAWAWACTPQSWGCLDARSIAEAMTSEMYEDATDALDLDGLQRVLDEWLEKQGPANAWMVNESRVVMLGDDGV